MKNLFSLKNIFGYKNLKNQHFDVFFHFVLLSDKLIKKLKNVTLLKFTYLYTRILLVVDNFCTIIYVTLEVRLNPFPRSFLTISLFYDFYKKSEKCMFLECLKHKLLSKSLNLPFFSSIRRWEEPNEKNLEMLIFDFLWPKISGIWIWIITNILLNCFIYLLICL